MYINMITVQIHTASCDDFLQCQGINSYFESLINNLSCQTFKNFELVYIDTYYEDNKEKFSKITSSFVVKHVPIHKNHRYWYDLGNTYISAAKNTGILYADGELVITFDDGEFFPENLLATYWNYYKNGCLMHAYHKRMKSIDVTDGIVKTPITGDVYINDSRNFSGDCQTHTNGTWTYAGTSFALEDALTLNGFNEKLDGYKSLEDCDFGIRLTMINRKFVIDKKDGFLYILDHPSYIDRENKKKKISEFVAIENYGMLCCSRELFEFEANKYPITQRHLDIIKRETMKFRQFDPTSEQDNRIQNLNTWMNVPLFNLRQERQELRNSTDWKW